MATVCKHLTESGLLAPKNADGLYPVTIISEGEGSTGRYSRELLESQADVFSSTISFADHPADPEKPWERSVDRIRGRLVGETTFAEEDGIGKIKGFFKPRAEYVGFFEEYADALGLSIYIGADGEVLEDGRLDVKSFDAFDPYKSVDIVVAAGRGGKFDRAAEALRVIENRTAAPADEMENEMTPEEVKKIVDEALAPVLAFVSETQQAAEAAKAAKAAEDAKKPTIEEAVDAFADAAEKVREAKLLPSQEKALLASARKGEDITAGLEEAKAIKDEAAKVLSESNDDDATGRRVESAGKGEDFSSGLEW